MLTILGAVTLSIFVFTIDSTELASEEGESMPDISGDRSLRDRDYNPEQVEPLHCHFNGIFVCNCLYIMYIIYTICMRYIINMIYVIYD